MINEIILKVQQIPNLLLGFIVIVGVIIFMYFNDPPVTACDIQMQEVNERLAKGFFKSTSRSGGYEEGVMTAFEICLKSNSPGGCHDMFSRFDYLEGLVKTIPSECGAHSSTENIKNFLAKGLRLFTLIAWGEKPPVNKYNKTAWLDTADLGLYCRLKRQYQRLYGRDQWNQFVWGFLPRLPEANGLQKQELWDKCLFSYNCTGLY